MRKDHPLVIRKMNRTRIAQHWVKAARSRALQIQGLKERAIIMQEFDLAARLRDIQRVFEAIALRGRA